MQLTNFAADLLPDLTRLINSHIASVPPKWTVSEAQVAAILDGPFLWAGHYPEDTRPFIPEIFCVLEHGHLIAAAQLCCPAAKALEFSAAEMSAGFLAWIVASPEHELGLRLLLNTLVQEAGSRGCEVIDTARYQFGVGWFGLPATWSHIITGLQRADFELVDRWVIMTGKTDLGSYPVQAPDSLLTTIYEVDEARRAWNLQAYRKQAFVGECQAWGVPEPFASCQGFQEWVTVEWIGVEEPYRRSGLGRWLLREQLHLQAQRGVKRVIVWTKTTNSAARTLCESFNFTYGPECYPFKKSLSGK